MNYVTLQYFVFKQTGVWGGGLLSLCSNCTRTFSRMSRLTPPHLQITRQYQWKKQTHYDVLGVHPEATQAEIKAAYLKLSKVWIFHNFIKKNFMMFSGASS